VKEVKKRRRNKGIRENRHKMKKKARYRGRDTSVGIATSYRLEGRGSIPVSDMRYFCSSQLLCPPSLLSN
jgi:hypothetical protein